MNNNALAQKLEAACARQANRAIRSMVPAILAALRTPAPAPVGGDVVEKMAIAMAPASFDVFDPKVHGSTVNQLATQKMWREKARKAYAALQTPPAPEQDAVADQIMDLIDEHLCIVWYPLEDRHKFKRLVLERLTKPQLIADAVVGGIEYTTYEQAKAREIADRSHDHGSIAWCAAFDAALAAMQQAPVADEVRELVEELRFLADSRQQMGYDRAGSAMDKATDMLERLSHPTADAVAVERERCAKIIGAIQPDEEAAGCPATWGDFVQIAQCAIRSGGA